MITANCTHCQYQTQVHDSMKGRRVRCPKCKGVFQIQGEEPPAKESIPFPATTADDTSDVILAMCPVCHFTKEVPAGYKGRSAKCPNCARVVTLEERPPDIPVETTLFTCPHCNTTRTVKAEYSGKKVRCPNCRQPSIIGGSEPAERLKVVEDLDAPGSSPAATEPNKERRRSKRVSVNDFDIAMGVIGSFPLKDVDEFGFGFDTIDSDWEFKRNQIINFDITSNGNLVLARMQARVARISYGSVGCVFIDLSPEQFRTLQSEMQNRKVNLQHEYGDNPLKTLIINLHKSGQLEKL